ncbi:MAG: prepilin-type N-terminal cleavage/methylation domain-containing protein [Planctomycetota bacterium]|jgi:prepilin-type N-terminal cleavage/methylation domain-containing protein
MRRAKGLTLVELAVVVVVVGVLAASAVPRFLASVERSKAAEAFGYLAEVQAAQERFHTREGIYADDLADLDVSARAPKRFSAGAIVAGRTGDLRDSWSLTLTRAGSPAGYGNYTVTFGEDGFDGDGSTITDYDDINPMAT